MRQGETIDATVGSGQSIEPKKVEVDFDESSPNTLQKENPVLVESSDPEQMGETPEEADKVQTNLPDDQSQCPDNQYTDKEVV